MANERVLEIAATGQIPANDPVSNIMAQVRPDAERGFWGSFKDWAGSKGGRMTLGGLGTALGVGLAGGDFKDALGYGIIGAGNTARTIYNNEQDAKRWADREAQRNLYWQNFEANRKLQQDLQKERLAAQKEQTAAQYQNALNKLAAQYQYNQMAQDAAETRAEARQNRLFDSLGIAPEMRPYMLASMNNIDLGGAMGNYNRSVLLNPDSSEEAKDSARQFFEAQKQLNAMLQPPMTIKDYAGIANDIGAGLDIGALNNGQAIFTEKTGNLPDDARMIDYYISQGYSPDEARQYVGALSPAEKTQEALNLAKGQALIDRETHAANAGVDFSYGQRAANAQTGRDMYMADYNARIAEAASAADFARNKELEAYKNSLPLPSQREITAQAQALGIPESAIYRQMYNKTANEAIAAEREAAVAGKTPQILNAEYLNANPDLSEEARGVFRNQGTTINLNTKAEEEYRKAKAKNRAEREKGEESAAMMRPAVEAAINRAERAARNGSGIGIVGGFLAGLGVNPAAGAGANYADIESANAQMNALLRQKLQATGLTGSELNSALEASAYRYTISPMDSEDVILRKLQNFRKDYLGSGDSGKKSGLRLVGVR